MKIYTIEEKNEARKKLPKPISDFLGSEILTKIYLGIGKKLNLNLRQMLAVSDITNVILMGLEPESVLETSLHQWLPELTNEATRELVADINDRIFKEAQRRLRERITEPEPFWDTDQWGPKIDYPPQPTDTELEKAIEVEEEEAKRRGITVNELEDLQVKEQEAKRLGITLEELQKKEVEQQATAGEWAWEVEEPEPQKETGPEKEVGVATPKTSIAIVADGIQLIEKGQMAGTRDVREMEEAPTDVHASSDSASISTQKLGAPTVATAQEVQVGESEYPVSSMKYQGKSKPEQARPRDGMDPYRETPE